MGWKLKDLEKMQASGKIKGFFEVKTKRPKPVKPEPKALIEMKRALDVAGIPYVTEHKFAPGRKFRFDISVPDRMIAIEYEGLMSRKSRHTTVTGYTKDASKYNLAQSLGWRVYRYTALSYTEFENDLRTILNETNS